SAGEVCYTKDAESGELSYWQWYSNVESLAGKTPLDTANRHIGWQDTTKPFYWIPYTGDQVGMPFFWLAEDAPEWAVMEINVDLPIAVYWRLARRYPDLVSDNVINTGEIRGEFLRVLDQGRGIDFGRVLSSHQEQSIQHHNLMAYGKGLNDSIPLTSIVHLGKRGTGADSVGLVGYSGLTPAPNDYYKSYNGTPYVKYSEGENVTRPSNVARPMAIAI
ncbi:phage tail protein, partial [Vibrio cholerae]